MEKVMRFGGSKEQMLKAFANFKYEWIEKVEFWENQISNDEFSWEITFKDAFLKTCV